MTTAETTEEARAAFLEAMEDACIESCEHNSKDVAEHNITIAADAYALAAHVDACTEVLMVDGKSWLCGGARGYCKRAKAIQQLGQECE